MTVLHKADQIKLFAVAKFCCHFVWKKWQNIHSMVNFFVAVTNYHETFFFNAALACVVDILSWSSEPEWVCTTENSQCDLYSSNPLIASWQNVYTTLSNSIQPVNGKAGRDIMFCIKPLKPLASQRGLPLILITLTYSHPR